LKNNIGKYQKEKKKEGGLFFLFWLSLELGITLDKINYIYIKKKKLVTYLKPWPKLIN
jgi:hypothetical protein